MRVLSAIESQYFSWPVKHGGTAMVDGALLMPGVTADTDLGVLIVAATAGADAIGALQGPLATTAGNTLVTGTVWNLRTVSPAFSGAVIRSEYDLTDTAAVASNSGTTLTITSLEDNIDTSWAYAVTGTGAGELSFLASSASGSATQKTAMGWSSDTTVIKILRLFHQLAKLNAAADKIGTDAAAGSWTMLVLQNWIQNTVRGLEILDPTVHDNLDGLNATGRATKFFCDLMVRNAGGYTID
jgi:hypothetical protein